MSKQKKKQVEGISEEKVGKTLSLPESGGFFLEIIPMRMIMMFVTQYCFSDKPPKLAHAIYVAAKEKVPVKGVLSYDTTFSIEAGWLMIPYA